jgi:hypothetical protein
MGANPGSFSFFIGTAPDLEQVPDMEKEILYWEFSQTAQIRWLYCPSTGVMEIPQENFAQVAGVMEWQSLFVVG